MCLSVLAAEAPVSIIDRDNNPPLVTIRQFLDGDRGWSETNLLKLQGVVTASLSDNSYFLQNGDAGVYIFHRPVPALRVGEWVEVTGHPSLGNLKPLLDGIAVRSLGTRGLPPAVAVTFAEAMSGQHHMRLIRIRGRLAEERPHGGRSLVLNAGGSTNSFLVNLEALPDYEKVSKIKPGSLLELTGVGSLRPDATGKRPVSLTVFARSAPDVVVVIGPPWWTQERMLAGLGIALGSGGLALLWVWTLRRQVRRQTTDLRARLEQETALELRYRQLFDANPHPMWVYDLETLGFLAVNEVAILQYGYSRGEFLGMTIKDIRPPEDVPTLLKNVARIETGLDRAGTWRHRKKDGRVIEVEITSHTMDFDGRRAALVLAHDVTERHRAEADLRASQERLATVFRASPDSIMIVRVSDERIVEVNPAFTRVTGFAGDEVKGRTTGEINLWMVPEERIASIAQVKQNGSASNVESKLRTKSGRVITVLGSGERIEFGGEPCLLSVARDITDRKEAEDALRRSEASLAGAQRVASLGSWELDLTDLSHVDRNPLTWSDEVFRIFGCEPGGLEVSNENFFRAVHPDDRQHVRQAMSEALAQRSPCDIEHRIIRPDGTERVVHEYSEMTFEPESGRPLRMMGVVQDITERKRADEALRESQQRFEELVSSVEGIVWQADARTLQFTFVSQQAERLLGYPVARWSEPGFWTAHLHPDDRAWVPEYCQHATVELRNHEFEYRMLATDGRVVWLRDIVTVVSEQGQAQFLRGIMVDITARKAAEEESRRTLTTLQLFIDSVPGYVSYVDADQRYQMVSLSYEQWFGCKRSEIVGRRLAELHPAAVYEEMRSYVEQSLTGQSVRYERCLPGLDGQPHWFDIRYIPRATKDGKVPGFFALVFDITKAKEAGEALRESRERLDGILDSLDDVVWSSTPDGSQMLYLNPAAEKIYDQPIAKFFANPHFRQEVIHPDDRAAVGAAFEELQRSERFASEYRIIRPDGTVRWLRDRGRFVKDATGRTVRLDGIGTDITTQREAEERIRNINVELEQRVQERTTQIDRLYRRQAALAEIEMAVNQPHELQQVLDRAVAVGSEGLGTRGGASIILWDGQQENFTVSASSLPGQPAQMATERVRRTGGASRWIVDHLQPVVVPDIREDPFRANSMLPEFGIKSYAGVPLLFEGKALGVFYLMHDQPRPFASEDVAFMEAIASRVAVAIFKVRLYEQVQGVNRIFQQRTAELQAANKELEAFSYSVSHDLRAPLRAIGGFSNILQQEFSSRLDEKGLRYLDRIRAGADRMGALIDDMLKLSRLSRAPLNRVPVDLTLLVQGILMELQTAEPARQVEAIVAPDLKATADPTLLHAALQNLVGNAWKYTGRRPQARIKFDAFDREGERVFFIRDNGTGFDMAYANKLFGAFQRLHRSDEFEGNGIGLATVQRVIHRHGGRVWAEASVDQGATFFFTLAPKFEPNLLNP